MKFMKLGIKPDTFQAVGNIRSVALEIASDFIVLVDGVTFHLHKFPLVSKSAKLHRLASEALEKSGYNVELRTFPGGVETFEICVKFCYGIKITLNAYNVIAVRCAAEELEMTESAEKGNLISKVEAFLNSYIFHGWKDSIIAFKSTQSLLPLVEELQMVTRCVNSITSKALTNPAKVEWSFTHTRMSKPREPQSTSEISQSPPWNGNQCKHSHLVQPDWWIEDIAELDIDLYSNVFLTLRSRNGTLHKVLGDALQFYTVKWLPAITRANYFEDLLKDNQCSMMNFSRERQLLERIVVLLPPEKGSNSCSFLLRLLKAATCFSTNLITSKELVRRVGLQLENASIRDLLIPYFEEPGRYLYDVDLVQSIVEEFMMQDQSPPTSPTQPQSHSKRRTKSAENINFVESRRSTSTTHGSKLRVSKLIDDFLAEIAIDPQLELLKFMTLAKSVPAFTRPLHDGIYRAIDVYLKKHPDVTKNERKKLCRLLDCKKLSMEACMHAAQNERLPLRTVVQVLFFEQVRAAMNGSGVTVSELPTTLKALMAAQEGDSREGTSGGLDDKWEEVQQNFEMLHRDLQKMKIKLSEVEKEHSIASNTPTKSKRFLSKLWPGKTSDGKKRCVIYPWTFNRHNDAHTNI